MEPAGLSYVLCAVQIIVVGKERQKESVLYKGMLSAWPINTAGRDGMHCRLGDLHGVKMFEVLHCNVVGSKPVMLWGKIWDFALLQSKSAKEADLEFLCENAPKFAASWFAKNKGASFRTQCLRRGQVQSTCTLL